MLLGAMPPGGGAARAQAAVADGSGCAALVAVDFAHVVDASTRITAASWHPADGKVLAHCQVMGLVEPAVGFDLRLPVAWNGKFAHVGCGGFCGAAAGLGSCAGVLARGYACITSDLGHHSTPLDARWAGDNLQAKFDFGVRATHVATLAGKAIVAHYYGRDVGLAYYLGCSTGGRQGLMEAQRFPADFNGIVAGAPVLDELGDGMLLLWNTLATLDRDGRQLFSFDDVRFVHAAVVAACDLNDGVKDGLIGDGRRCRFRPETLACRAGAAPGCLSAAQIAALVRIYRGPTGSRGKSVYPAAVLPGSELNWLHAYVGEGGRPATYLGFMGELFRYMAFSPDAGAGWRPAQFDWDRDPARLGVMSALYNADNPDLRRFRAAGGKLLLYAGWADQSVMPGIVTDYYEAVVRTMGGEGATRPFARLFMVPGMAHCSGGEGAWRIDHLSAIETWVERGTAPDALLGQHPREGAEAATGFGVPPLAAGAVAFSRRHYAYPAEARYRGGDPAAAASFAPAAPPRRRPD